MSRYTTIEPTNNATSTDSISIIGWKGWGSRGGPLRADPLVRADRNAARSPAIPLDLSAQSPAAYRARFFNDVLSGAI